MTYRERREARAERLTEWAGKRETKAAERFETADRMASVIPFGQPILVGHYSEGRDRRYRDRIGSNMSKGVEHARKAEQMRSKAATIGDQLARSIYSDDPDAVEQLEARLTVLEAERDRVKRYNATCRKGQRDVSILTEAEQRQIVRLVETCPWQSKQGEFPRYHLANLSGNIKRNRDRLEQLRREASGQWGEPYGPGPHYLTPELVTVTMRRKGQRVRFYDGGGTQHGPEQANVAPAVAYALSEGWVRADQAAPVEPGGPNVHCERCGVGPFFYVEERPYPALCLDCAELVTPSATTLRQATP